MRRCNAGRRGVKRIGTATAAPRPSGGQEPFQGAVGPLDGGHLHPLAALVGLGGPAGLSALRQLSQDLRVIVLGGFGSDREELAFVRAGARACCDTAISLVLLARAIEAVLRGEVWIRRALTGSLVTELAALEAATGAAIANRRCSTPVV